MITAAVVGRSCRSVAATVVSRSCRSVAAAVVVGSAVVIAVIVAAAIVVAGAGFYASDRCVASAVVTVHPVVLHITLTGSIVHLITSVIIHNVLLSGKLHRKVRLHVYSMNNCRIGAYNWGRKIRLFLLTFLHENYKINS